MRRWARRLRGVLGIGAIWGVATATLGILVGLFGIVFGGVPLTEVLQVALGAFGFGFVLGAGFATVLTTIEGRRTLDQLTPGRGAAWGAVAGALVAIGLLTYSLGPVLGTIFSIDELLLVVLAGSGAYGAVSAALGASTVVLARRAPTELSPDPSMDGREPLDSPARPPVPDLPGPDPPERR